MANHEVEIFGIYFIEKNINGYRGKIMARFGVEGIRDTEGGGCQTTDGKDYK